MYMLVLQTFLLMLAAFLLGCTLACIVKRSLNRVAAADGPADYMQVDAPPTVPRSAPEPVAPARPPVPVSPGETQRFERALTGDVASAASVAETSTTGPMIEVQAPPAPPTVDDRRDDTASGLAAAAAAAAAASVVAAQSSERVEYEVPSYSRPDDAPDAPDPSYAAIALAEGGSTPGLGETYNAIAVASHDGSMLPPPGVIEAELPPPQMPEPAPEPLPVPAIDVPVGERPDDAPEDPDPNYVAEAIAAGAEYVPPAPSEDAGFDLPEVSDDYTLPPEGETYASVATGAVAGGVAAAATAVAGALDDVTYETKSTHASTALAAAAGMAAQRAAGDHAGDDLTRIQGIDEVLASRLNYVGVTRFAQIARWSGDDLRRMSQTLGFFGRIEDEYWIGQARELAEKQGDLDDGFALPDDTPPTVSHATPAGAADIATAAAAAAAAAMAATAHARRSPEGSANPSYYDSPAPSRVQDSPAPSGEGDTGSYEFEPPKTEGEAEPVAEPESGFDEFETPADANQPEPVVETEDGFYEFDAPAANNATSSAGDGEFGFDEFDQSGDGAADAGGAARSDLAGLRSVKSESLRGDDVDYSRAGLDDLKRIRGIGVLIEKKLNSLGIVSYEQVANWSTADIERISELLDFKGRIERENWIEQARILASGGQTEFSRRVDRGEV